ncbi:MAG: dienelactone hydrolase family protein [Armatimonadetes bacterium]|nr:dienelactone hydrolase family protein [Armatimonadota bacterium]
MQSVLTDLLNDTWREADRALWGQRRARILAAFTDLLGEGAPASPPEPEVRWLGEERQEGLVIRKLSFLVEPDDRVYAYLVLPPGLSAPAPAVLCLHGTTYDAKDACLGRGQNPAGSNRTAIHLAQRGFVVLAPDHFCAGERLKPGEKPYDSGPLYARHPEWSDVGKSVYDHMRCTDLLRTLPEVDGDRIGAIGHSLGGYSTVFFAAMDGRVRAAVSSCGVTGSWNVDANRANWSRTQPGRYVHFPKLRHYWEADRKAPVDFHEIIALMAPRAFLNISAVGNDPCFQVFAPFSELYYQVESVYKLLGAEGKFAVHFHSCGHSFTQSARALAYTWLEEQLLG